MHLETPHSFAAEEQPSMKKDKAQSENTSNVFSAETGPPFLRGKKLASILT